MQALEKIRPVCVNTNAGALKLKPDESPFLKNYRIAFGRNSSGEMGGNFGLPKKFQSNWPLVSLALPAGVCKTVLFYEHALLNEAYIGIWNDQGKHTLYILYGNTLTSDIVYQGPELDWTTDPKNFMAEHRCYVRVIYDVDESGSSSSSSSGSGSVMDGGDSTATATSSATASSTDRHIREKIFFFTDGRGWQRWINVLSAVATKGYDASQFSYYTLFGPHFDKNELIDYAMRPPVYCPVLTALPRTAADTGLTNYILNKSIAIAYRYVYTDGRGSVLSPYSNPFFVARSPCAASTGLTRSFDVAMNAGGPHVEQVQVLVRNCGGDWLLYDTIDKFSREGANDPAVIGDAYWLRVNPWENGGSSSGQLAVGSGQLSGFSYDAAANILHYKYSGDLQVTPFPKEDQVDFYNNVPIRSYALTAAGDALIWANNLFNYNNLAADALKKFQLAVGGGESGSSSGSCNVKNVKITVYAYMARDGFLNQVVYSEGPDPHAQKLFGGIYANLPAKPPPKALSWNTRESHFYGLNFGNNPNFICYLAGTPYLATGVQYQVSADGLTMTETDALDSTNTAHLVRIQNVLAAGGFFVQKFVFNVPAGNYIARLARHNADITGEYQATSTYVQGLADHKKLFKNNNGLFPNSFLDDPGNFTKEFAIDATAGDVDMWGKGRDLFFVFVPFFDIGWSEFAEGNVLEDSVNPLNTVYPIEQLHYAPVYEGITANTRTAFLTDHNGFFFSYTATSIGVIRKFTQIKFYGNFKCAFNSYMFQTAINFNGGTAENKINHYYSGIKVTIEDNYDLAAAMATRIVVTGKVLDCASGAGIPSIGVTLTNGPTFYTDTNGVFTYYARGNWAGVRKGEFYFNSGGACLFIGCGCQAVATIPFTTAGIACDPKAPRTGPDLQVLLQVVVQAGRGLKGGGRYGISGNFLDLAGRTTFSQPMGYLDIPTFMETGVFTPSAVSWKVSGKLNLPSFVKYFTFSRTVNLHLSAYTQWVGDKIDFIDSKGNIVPDGVGAIRARITIRSLLDFNIESNFNTNVSYQFVANDMLRIMDDGAGNLFAPGANNGFLDYQILGTTYNQSLEGAVSNQAQVSNAVETSPAGAVTTISTTSITNPVNATSDGVSFIIEYDERLLALKNKTGFWMEMERPRGQEPTEPYSEIVGTVPVVDGEPVFTSGILDTFDTWYQQRSIRIPNALGQTFAHPFESASVTDYSSPCGDNGAGRLNVPDPLAKQTWYENETIETDQIVNAGRVNGLGRCREANRKNFKGQNFGGIVAVHAERNRLIFICERDWFVTDYEMNYVKATREGLLQSNTDETIGRPFPKEGSVFGCAYEDTASIIFYDGTSIWADRYNAGVIALDYRHNQSVVPIGYRDAVDITAEETKSYFINKFNYLLNYNASLAAEDYLDNLMEIVAGIDPQTGEYNITFRPRNGLKSDPQYFVNNEREVFYDMPETFVYNPDFKKWVSFAGYAPEFYGKLSKSVSGMELIAFAAGQPWFHNSLQFAVCNWQLRNGTAPDSYRDCKLPTANCFFGVQTDQVIEVAMNAADEKVKIFQNIIVASPDVQYFADRVLTEDRRFFSYVPLAHFKKKEQVWYAPFLCNMNTYPNVLKPVGSMLLDGKRTFGKVALVRLVSDPQTAADYGEIESVAYRITASELSGK